MYLKFPEEIPSGIQDQVCELFNTEGKTASLFALIVAHLCKETKDYIHALKKSKHCHCACVINR